MLSLTIKENGELHIDPMDGIDPSTTVEDLFRNGPICIQITKVRSGKQVRVGIDA